MGIRASKIQPEGKPRFWYRDNFFLTTDKTYLEPELVNQAFASDLMWWNQPIEPTQMKKMLDNCFTVCVFSVAETEEQMKKNGPPKRRAQGKDYKFAGLARLVTDYVSFAYLTDVFVLEDFQRKGLASWMMRCIKEMVDEWPDLRGLMLMTHDKAAAKMYERTLGAVDFDKGPSAGLAMLEMAGRAEKEVPEGH